VLEAATQGRIADDSVLHRIPAHRDQREAYERLRHKFGRAAGGHAVAWLLRNLVVSTTIVGAPNNEELRSDLGALSVPLDDEIAERVDRIWPGPGEAPRAYV
jgi:aryl-alcohol dehydrogenase-like predicted oxidoreductase